MKSAVVLSLAAILMVTVSATFFDDDFFDDDIFDDDFGDFDDDFYFGRLGGWGGMAFGQGGHFSLGHGGALAGGFGHIGNFIHKPVMNYGPWCNKAGGYGKVLAHKTMVPSKVVYPSVKGMSSYYSAGGASSYDSGAYGYSGSVYSGNTGYPASYSAGGVASYAGANQYAAGSSGYQPVVQNYY